MQPDDYGENKGTGDYVGNFDWNLLTTSLHLKIPAVMQLGIKQL